MRKQKRWIALFLTVTLVSGVTGCSTGKENATGGTLPIEKGTALADVFDSEEYAVEEAEEEEIPVSTYEGLTFIKPEHCRNICFPIWIMMRLQILPL